MGLFKGNNTSLKPLVKAANYGANGEVQDLGEASAVFGSGSVTISSFRVASGPESTDSLTIC